MIKKADLELYTDYLISTISYATATGLSSMLDGEFSHDKVTRFLSERLYTSKDLWKEVKLIAKNLLNAVYHHNDVSLAVAFEIVKKPHLFSDIKTRQVKRASEITKNEHLRHMRDTCVANGLKFGAVLVDCWFAATENFEHILKKGKHFIAALKSNRLIALSGQDKKQGLFMRIDALSRTDKQTVRGCLKGFSKEVLFVR